MRRFPIAALVALAAASPTAGAETPGVVAVPAADPDMARAEAKARATLPGFLEHHGRPDPSMSRFAVKIGVERDGEREFFWLNPFRIDGDMVRGVLANDSEKIAGLHKGQVVEIARTQIVDWMYVENGRMRGNYTACVLVARLGAASLAAYQRDYKVDCAAP